MFNYKTIYRVSLKKKRKVIKDPIFLKLRFDLWDDTE